MTILVIGDISLNGPMVNGLDSMTFKVRSQIMS